MGVSIILALVLISFIWNIAKKNKVYLNILMVLVPIILTMISVTFTYYDLTSTANLVMNLINLISCTFALIIVIISILLVVKDRKTIKSSKAILLIGIAIAYICMLILSKPRYGIFLANDYLRKIYITNVIIGLLFILQLNLFTNLISNNKKEESNGK